MCTQLIGIDGKGFVLIVVVVEVWRLLISVNSAAAPEDVRRVACGKPSMFVSTVVMCIGILSGMPSRLVVLPDAVNSLPPVASSL